MTNKEKMEKIREIVQKSRWNDTEEMATGDLEEIKKIINEQKLDLDF